MRSIYLLVAVVCMLGCAETKSAEEPKAATETTKQLQVPQNIQNNFAEQHPDAEDVEWEMEGNRYEVEFEEGDKEMSIIYNADGSLYATETDMNIDALPDAVKTAVAEKGTAAEASALTLADGTMQYEVEIGDTEYLYDADGSIISKSENDDDDDEEEGMDDDSDDDEHGDDDGDSDDDDDA